MSRPARPVAMHDTAQLEREQRAERRAQRIVLVIAAVTISYALIHARELAQAVIA
ncbi:MAG: hypothetical protein ACREO4_16220 [Lysobacter sp.]